MLEPVVTESIDTDPVDIEVALTQPRLYEDMILRVFTKRRQQGQAFNAAADGLTYFDAVTNRRSLARAIARTVASGSYRPEPVRLWFLETKGKRRAAHMPGFIDHVVGAALYQLLSRNARAYGLPGVYSYLPGLTNATAMRDLARFVRAHRRRVGPKGPPLYVLQSDFDKYGDTLPVGPDAPLWPILYDIAALGSPGREISGDTWNLITAFARPVVRDADGAEFTRRSGLVMGTPIVPLLANLAVLPMDDAVLGIRDVFYARYNDDFLLAHPDLAAIQEADARISSVIEGLGVSRKSEKERRTALSANGIPAPADPAYRGRNRIDYLGLSVTHTGTMTVGPHRLRRFIGRVTTRIDGAAPALSALPTTERARHLVSTVNVMLDATDPFAVPGLSALLQSTTDRGVLKDLDFRIARKIVQVASGRSGLRGFRALPPRVLYHDLGLVSLVHLRNLR